MAVSLVDLSGSGEDFLGNVGSSFFKFTLRSLGKAVAGDPEAALISAALHRAVQGAADRMRPPGHSPDPELDQAVADALNTILSSGTVRAGLVEAATTGQSDLDTLTGLAEQAGLDAATLPFAWTAFLDAFLAAFEREMRQEASRPGSPLQGRVALGELFRLRKILTQRVETVEDRIDYLVQGLLEVGRHLPFKDFLLEYKQFLVEYLGCAGRPKPFGGRAFELDAMNAWLVDPEAAGKMLLVAPAGRGKSSLVVHWVRQLPRDIALVFIPVSLRFQTADPTSFLPALALKLAQLHGLNLDEATVWNPAACRAVASELMQRELPDGRLLLVVVDGLDEATSNFHWGGLFPASTPRSVRIVVTARRLALDGPTNGWLTRLAWDGFAEDVRPLELPGLSHDEVTEVLDNMELAAPDAPARDERAMEIWRLSEGDPLLVGLYAEQLWHQQQTHPGHLWSLAELRRLDPGLKAFFERWAQDQEAFWGGAGPWNDATARGVLSVLALALGPLVIDELRELAQRAFSLRLGSARAFLAPLARFVVGDGVAQGLVLAHPRLNEFFASPEFIGAGERSSVEAAFLGWGAEIAACLNDGRVTPNRAPAYVLRHYGSHLSQAKSLRDAYRVLLGEGWAVACELADPTHRGLLNDVQRAWDAMATEPSDLGGQVRCLLFFGSLQSPYQLPPPATFAAAITLGTLTPRQVLSILAFGIDRPDFDERAEQLVGALADEVGSELADLLDLRPPMIGKVRALTALALALRGPERIRIGDRAIRAARACSNPFERVCAGALVLPFLGADAEYEAALIVEQLADEDGRRISPEVVAALAAFAPERAAAFATAGVERYFVLAGFAPDPAGRRMMALAPEAERQRLIGEALTRLLAEDIRDNGAALAIVGPAMTAQHRRAAWAKIQGAPLDHRLALLSQFIDAPLAAEIPELPADVLEAVRTSGGVIGSLAFVDWAPLLSALPRESRRQIASRLLETFGHLSGSSAWLDLTAQLLPFMSNEERSQIVVIAVRKGRLHHDQSAILESLAALLPLLPAGDQANARRRLVDRVDLYLADRPVVGDARRTVLALPLMPFASPDLATVIAEALFTARLKGGPGHIAPLCQVLPFLGDTTRRDALGLLDEWLETLEWAPSEPTLMEAAQPWLGRAKIERAAERMLPQAAAETQPQIAGSNAAQLLGLLDPAKARALASELIGEALAEPDWDDQWCYIARACLAHLPEEEVAASIYPAALRCPLTRDNRLALVLDIAACCDGDLRVAILQRAVELAGPLEWPTEKLPLLLAAVEPTRRLDLMSDLLRSRVAERRVRQLRSVDVLAPWIAITGERMAQNMFDALWDVGAWWP